MEYIIVLIIFLVSVIGLFFIFNINIKKLKQAGKNEKLDKIISKFPENKKVCETILEMIGNSKVKIKENENKENKSSLYIAISDTIFIANIKESYTRIQTIAHECLHSVQDRRLLLFNFIYSNIYILYFILSLILLVTGIEKNYYIQIIILTLMGFIYYAVRSYLETDAMTKARYLADEYMKKENNYITDEERKEIIEQYDKINKIGIPATNYILMTNCIIKIILYTIVAVIKNLT